MAASSYMSLMGRVLIALIFIMSGIHKIAAPQETQHYMIMMGLTWATTLLYVGAILVEVLGGLSLLLGYKTKLGAMMLIAFMIPTTLLFHMKFGDQNQMIHFMKNLAMIGGLLYVAQHGAGRLSMDHGARQLEEGDRPGCLGY